MKVNYSIVYRDKGTKEAQNSLIHTCSMYNINVNIKWGMLGVPFVFESNETKQKLSEFFFRLFRFEAIHLKETIHISESWFILFQIALGRRTHKFYLFCKKAHIKMKFS
jgi:hypothetical protein